MKSQGVKDLIVYQKAYNSAMKIFECSKTFPSGEKYSLTDQIRRSSRSVCACLAEAYRKRRYPKHFVSKVTDSDAEAAETLVHLDFAKDCGYINENDFHLLCDEYDQIGKILNFMINYPEKFCGTKLPTATAN
jgi:four helix bundle protein